MQLTIVLPDEIGEKVQRLPDPSRFIAEILSRALSQRRAAPETASVSPATGRRMASSDRGRWLSAMRAALKVQGQPLAIEEIQAMSRRCELEENELSQSVIKAREP